ncbi:uncharacterized protein LOC8284597 [Ricinus communis]|uniref:Uncharacterized protein n=1 Tax=Ricinus communis TaxID=3988 RepID=B9S1F0_RICCO|nr:uncharacterized protein LOC8284597 [Ricinus communis]EEF42419.1 conserved hypothetical protein [Ricinus communis]|eukprot:XP_002519815.1 uncharacterized protein LOC8284597 [Ricinus communis]
MSLNCLTCRDLQRNNSGTEYDQEGHDRRICCIKVERSWSGNLTPPPYEQVGKGNSAVAARKIKKDHRRLKSMGAIAFKGTDEPKLIRSSGMRRDWSFEDLRQRGDQDRKECRAY